jgi:hypothetical protein
LRAWFAGAAGATAPATAAVATIVTSLLCHALEIISPPLVLDRPVRSVQRELLPGR